MLCHSKKENLGVCDDCDIEYGQYCSACQQCVSLEAQVLANRLNIR